MRLSLVKFAQGSVRETPDVSNTSVTLMADGKVRLGATGEVPTTPDCASAVALSAGSVGQAPPVPAAFLAHSVTLA